MLKLRYKDWIKEGIQQALSSPSLISLRLDFLPLPSQLFSSSIHLSFHLFDFLQFPSAVSPSSLVSSSPIAPSSQARFPSSSQPYPSSRPCLELQGQENQKKGNGWLANWFKTYLATDHRKGVILTESYWTNVAQPNLHHSSKFAIFDLSRSIQFSHYFQESIIDTLCLLGSLKQRRLKKMTESEIGWRMEGSMKWYPP